MVQALLEEYHMTPPDPDEPTNLSTILYRLTVVDKRLERMETSLTTLQFPSLDLYRSEQSAQNERIATAVTLSMWALGVVCILVIGAIITAIVAAIG